MYSTIKRCKWLTLLLLAYTSVWGQENLTVYWQPSLALNYKVKKNYSHNFALINRNFTFKEASVTLDTRHVDIVHFSNLKIRENQSIAFGILYRFRDAFDDAGNELRLTQQFNLVQRPLVVRYGHRFRTEQRITNTNTIHRFRYRFTLDFPLRGEALDLGEPYLVGNIENLLSVGRQAKPEYDTRFTLNLGWKITDRAKFQIGAEYRLEDYAQNLQHVCFLLTTLNYSL
ncbi:DUF2490 domain-containing protein [Croceitalea dokdonensis]|uniref:DUF2490 domain-containing protein n=1 Tax=Croceitalea dokdonensis TaxID=346188 RepID=UPI0012F94C6A|nr:DUF2490 domain-containing protein [Croceitalea dokdonensis]